MSRSRRHAKLAGRTESPLSGLADRLQKERKPQQAPPATRPEHIPPENPVPARRARLSGLAPSAASTRPEPAPNQTAPADRARRPRRVPRAEAAATGARPSSVLERFSVVVLLILVAGAGVWSGGSAQKALYASARTAETVNSTQPRLLPAPVPIYTPTPTR